MKKLRVLIIILVIAAVAFGGYKMLSKKGASSEEGGFEFTAVKRGNIENIVSCTGTIEPLGSVDVGTELSGTIEDVLVDFNDVVKKNQVLAILDTTQLAINLRTSKADLMRSRAQFELSKMTYESDLELHKKGFISDIELQNSKTSYHSSEASLISSEASYEKSYNNLHKYAIIRSPINGTVIHRNVDPGQTVAASYSTPTLFTVAENLANIQIEALVDEGDIGQIKEGMDVVFSVESYPDLEFEAKAKQVRLQPQTVSNVVNYTVIVEAENDKGILLPGMTATVEFIIEQKLDVLMVQTSALKFQPSREMMMDAMKKQHESMDPKQKADMEKRRKEFQNMSQSERQAMMQKMRQSGSAGMGPGMGSNGGQRGGKDMTRVWYVDENGSPQMLRVKKGVTDGANTEISGNDVTEGLQLIYKQKKTSSVPRHMKRGLF